MPTAAHLGGDPNNQFVLNGVTYHVDTSFIGSGPGWINDPSTDLRLWKIQETFPTVAPLWDDSVDGSPVGKTMIVFGRGTARGSPVYAEFAGPPRDGSPPKPTPGPGGDVKPGEFELKGWQWGAFDSVQAWGTNVVSGTLNVPPFGDLMYFDFDRNGLFDEGALSNGDS